MSSDIEYLRTLLTGHDRGDWTAEQVVERLHQVIAPERIEHARSWSEFRSSLMLRYLNEMIFWPRGFALALIADHEGTIFGWDLVGDGKEPIESARPDVDWRGAIEKMLEDLRE